VYSSDQRSGREIPESNYVSIMISVIIPSYNSENTIEKCLKSLLNQSYHDDYEIILVDSSADKTPEIVSAGYPTVKLIHLDKKTDPGTARNIGIGMAKGGLIAFIDSDCMAAYEWLEKIDAAHQSYYNIIGGVVNNGNEKDDLVGWAGYISEFREFLPEQPKQEVMHIPTCNISYKRRVFLKFGMFQGEYYPQEDLVYNYNLCKNGEKLLLDPTIQIYHHHRSGLKDYLYHQNKIGTITSKVLKLIQLEGSFVVRHPTLAIFLIPFLPMVKFTRTVLIFLKFQPESITKRPLVLLLFALGLFYWVTGFARGIYEKSQS
jgi:glycosyltransferase involved in cell wall biosynthesis